MNSNRFCFCLQKKCITEEKSAYVRMCMATIIGRLSDKAISFLDQYQDHNYDEELNLLHKYFQNLVSTLITDPVNCVRRFLLSTPKNCAKLCAFFGRQKTNEMILSHIITFLNDKVFEIICNSESIFFLFFQLNVLCSEFRMISNCDYHFLIILL